MLASLALYTRRTHRRFLQDENGAAFLEYALLVGLIAVGCVGAIITFGQLIAGYYVGINAAL